MVQIKKVRGQVKKTKHEPLDRQIKRDYQLPDTQAQREQIPDHESDEDEDSMILDPKTSLKILAQSRLQLQSEEAIAQSTDSEASFSDLPNEEYEDEPSAPAPTHP